jgi:hypothetical protein
MNENMLKTKSKSAFNYTLLLDDVIEFNHHPSDSLDYDPYLSFPCADAKLEIAECRTHVVNLQSENDFDAISPMKPSNSKNFKGGRLRKSDGGIPWSTTQKLAKVNDFLTETSENEDEEFPILDINDKSKEKVNETKSEIMRNTVCNFSLSSCFKDNFSHFNKISFNSSKLNVDSSPKINLKKLRNALKNKHFDNIIGRLSSLIENGSTRRC